MALGDMKWTLCDRQDLYSVVFLVPPPETYLVHLRCAFPITLPVDLHTHTNAHALTHTQKHCGFTQIRSQAQGSFNDVATSGRQHYQSRGNREMVLIQTEATAVV